MKKYFILNVVLNLAIAFIVYSGMMAYQAGNQTLLFIAIALLVVLIYLKVVLLKVVRSETKQGGTPPQRKSKKV